MFSWSARHRFFYIFGTLAIFAFVIILPIFFFTYKAPSCSDGIKNQGELGIDCGGPCARLCEASALRLIIRWQRAFKVKDGVYNALAYVENPNLDSGIDTISYRFKLYDSANILIYERDGTTSVPPNKIFGVFESNILTGLRVPARVLFEFLGTPVWTKSYAPDPGLVISNKVLSNQDTSPRLAATLQNSSISPVYNTEVVAILYDVTDNALAVSRTVVNDLNPGSMAPLVFTWPEPFTQTATRIELLYRLTH